MNALSYDEELLSEDQAKFLKMKLKQRIQHIEDTIDIHLNTIGGLEKYIDRSYIYKLLVLEYNEERIKQKNISLQRLTDVMQSYYIYDADVFFKEKGILSRIDREILELDYLDYELPIAC